MNSRHLCHFRVTAAVAAVIAFSWAFQSQAQTAPPPLPADEQPEILTRGPVHEAFAEPVILQYQVGLIAPVQPPENIIEIPPTDRPAGDRFAWVPGYWSWDGDRRNYIWVSACSRTAPPDMAWVPGYWSQAINGWEWVPGFWNPAGTQEIEYLPAPPVNDSVEAPGPPPMVDNTWVPPCYYWADGRYVQRPGYWLNAQPGWVWVASHYLWTPRGYVFAAGHWDYALEDRGVLFAPVYIPARVYARAGYSYSPSAVIDVELLSVNFFVSPRYSHYYYGDYYDDVSIQMGIFGWFDHDRIPDYYDPIYEYDRSRTSRTQPRWDQQVQRDYDARRADVALRPARTYRDMETRIAQAPAPQRRSLEVVRPLSVVVLNSTTNITNVTNITNTQTPGGTATATPTVVRATAPVKFEKITPAAQTKIATQAADVKKLGNDRKGWEATAANPKVVTVPTAQRGPDNTPGAARGRGVATPADRNPPVPAVQTPPMPTVRNEPTPPPAGRNPAVIPPAVEKEPAVATPADRKPPAPAISNPPIPPAARNEPTPRKTVAAPPREVPVAQPEKVRIPTPSADAKSAPAAEKGPPPKPVNEAKGPSDAKGGPKKEDPPASRPSDTPGRGPGNGRGN